MSIGGDEYERERAGDMDPSMGRGSARRGTRTRLPGEDGDGGGRRPPNRPGRNMVTVLGVVVLLIAAIAFANRGGGDSGSDGDDGSEQASDQKEQGTQPTAPSGKKPVDGQDAATGIPSGFPQSEQGAESAAANYAVALGGDRMFKDKSRHEILEAIIAPESLDKFRTSLDKAYSAKFFENLGLQEDGSVPDGQTFVSRTTPIGTQLTDYGAKSATVEVWCSGLLGLAGKDSKKPVTSEWFTVTFKLVWVDGGWKAKTHSQEEGPAPVNGDTRVAGEEEITEAVEGYGGLTYAR